MFDVFWLVIYPAAEAEINKYFGIKTHYLISICTTIIVGIIITYGFYLTNNIKQDMKDAFNNNAEILCQYTTQPNILTKLHKIIVSKEKGYRLKSDYFISKEEFIIDLCKCQELNDD
jgi:hypothetical protein